MLAVQWPVSLVSVAALNISPPRSPYPQMRHRYISVSLEKSASPKMTAVFCRVAAITSNQKILHRLEGLYNLSNRTLVSVQRAGLEQQQGLELLEASKQQVPQAQPNYAH